MKNTGVLLYRNSAIRHIIKPLENKGYIIDLVGSLSSDNGRSNNDIDILLYIPKTNGNNLFDNFEKDLENLGFKYMFSDEKEGFGIFHNYCLKGKIGLDIWINEVDDLIYKNFLISVENYF